jgi:hypothetical protein
MFGPDDLVIAASDGIDVRFAGIELNIGVPPGPEHPERGKGVRIRLAGVQGEETQRRDAALPGLGTGYRCVKDQMAGDGTNWEASWLYLPGPPDAARILSIRFTMDGVPTGKECEVLLRLHRVQAGHLPCPVPLPRGRPRVQGSG